MGQGMWKQVNSQHQLGNFLCGGGRISCTPSCSGGCRHGDYIPGNEFLVLKSTHGNFLSAGISTWTDHLENNAIWAKNDEKFVLEFQDSGEVAIRTSANTYWSAQPSGQLMADRTWVNEWEKFTLYVTENEIELSIKTYHNQWVSAQPDGRVEANRPNREGWEIFTGLQAVPAMRKEAAPVMHKQSGRIEFNKSLEEEEDKVASEPSSAIN